MIEFISIDLDNLVELDKKTKSYKKAVSNDKKIIKEHKDNINYYEKELIKLVKAFNTEVLRYNMYIDAYDKYKNSNEYTDSTIRQILYKAYITNNSLDRIISMSLDINNKIEEMKRELTNYKKYLGLGKIKLETLKLKIKNNNINLKLPGIYIIRDKCGNILYIGESSNIYNRLNIKHKMFNVIYVSEMYNIIVIPINNEIVRCQCETLLSLNIKPKYSSVRKENYGQAAQLIKLSTEETDKEANSIVAEVIKNLSL